MTNPIETKARELKALVAEAVQSLYGAECEFAVIRPRDRRNGELAATAALVLGKALRRPPLEIAAEIAAEISLPEGERAEPGGKGFVNFFLKPDFLFSALKTDFTLPEAKPLDFSAPDFERIYPVQRLAALLRLHKPCGEADFSLLSRSEELRLLWEIFSGDGAELMSAAVDFYDKVGINCGYAPLDAARRVLLGNAVCTVGALYERKTGD